MKRGKEIETNILNNFRTTYGTVDVRNPKSIFLTINTWAQPKSKEDINYTRIIKDINKLIKQQLFNNINREIFISDKIITDLDLRESGIVFGKRSFVDCEITLFQINNHELESEIITSEAKRIIELIVKEVLEKNETFTFFSSKKDN